jgi:putative membrane protein
MLTREEEQRINAAVAEAERGTSGEIFCILAKRTSSYAEVPIAYASIAALLLPLAMVAVGFHPWEFGWSTGEAEPEQATLAYAALQAIVFMVVLLVTAIRPVRMMLAPEPLKRSRVQRIALQQFMAKGLHQTEGRTGVLIFAAAEERRAEVIADEGIYRKVDAEVWTEALEARAAGLKRKDAAEGFVEAVRLCGAVLAQHFPAKGDNPNELPDQIVTI